MATANLNICIIIQYYVNGALSSIKSYNSDIVCMFEAEWHTRRETGGST
jgi:hypothetical protein